MSAVANKKARTADENPRSRLTASREIMIGPFHKARPGAAIGPPAPPSASPPRKIHASENPLPHRYVTSRFLRKSRGRSRRRAAREASSAPPIGTVPILCQRRKASDLRWLARRAGTISTHVPGAEPLDCSPEVHRPLAGGPPTSRRRSLDHSPEVPPSSRRRSLDHSLEVHRPLAGGPPTSRRRSTNLSPEVHQPLAGGTPHHSLEVHRPLAGGTPHCSPEVPRPLAGDTPHCSPEVHRPLAGGPSTTRRRSTDLR